MGSKNTKQKKFLSQIDKEDINALAITVNGIIRLYKTDMYLDTHPIDGEWHVITGPTHKVHVLCQHQYTFPKDMTTAKNKEELFLIRMTQLHLVNHKASTIMNNLDDVNDYIILNECHIVFDQKLDSKTLSQLLKKSRY